MCQVSNSDSIESVRKILPVLLLLGLLVTPSRAVASCSVSVSPSNVVMGTSSTSTFNVSNTGDQMGNWVRIQSPGLTAYSIASMNATGWYPNGGGTEANFAGGYLEGLTNANFDLTLAETGEVINSMSWEALVSYDAGSSFESCGSANITVDAAPVAPTISNASLTVGNSSATLTWNTDRGATGTVNYGTTSGYGSSATTVSGTSHSATMSGLSASTEYHYQIQATSEGGTTSTVDATFTTSAASVTTTTTTTVTNTVTNTATVSKTVILADTIKPVVKIETKLDQAVAQAPIMEGKIVDSGSVNVGIVKVQYSVDGGKSWLLVDEPSGASKVEFSFVPEVYEDGNYEVLVRATDKSGNTGVSAPQTLIIDRLPPRIIHSLWRVGPIILSAPYQFVLGVPVQVAVQGIGGVTEMKLEIGNSKFELIKNSETGLWENEIVIYEAGNWEIMVSAKDGGGNVIEQNIGNVDMRANDNSPLRGAETTIYRYDELTKRFKVWNGEVYGQANPSTGKTSWYLPSGKYYMESRAKGFKTAQTEIFNIDQPGVVGVEGGLEKWGWNNWWKRGELRVNHNSQILKFSNSQMRSN